MSLGAVKGFEIGEGMNAARLTGSVNNDAFVMRDGKISKATNHSGGVLGGMSDGSELVFRAAFKPTPSISSLQKTVDRSGKETEVSVKGRHDPIIAPRAAIVVHSMAAIVIADMLLLNMSSRINRIKSFYKEIIPG